VTFCKGGAQCVPIVASGALGKKKAFQDCLAACVTFPRGCPKDTFGAVPIAAMKKQEGILILLKRPTLLYAAFAILNSAGKIHLKREIGGAPFTTHTSSGQVYLHKYALLNSKKSGSCDFFSIHNTYLLSRKIPLHKQLKQNSITDMKGSHLPWRTVFPTEGRLRKV
jgi:hypothetical protein